jgi:predicted dehydrogenase
MSHRVVGDLGEAFIPEFINVHRDDRLIITTRTGSRTEHLGTTSTYRYQLTAFTRAVRTGRPAPTDAVDAVATMRLIDDCYRAIGLQPRPRHR